MRQAGIIAAGALYAVENHRDRLAIDHQHAQALGEACAACGPLAIRGDRIDTNIVICEIDPDWNTAEEFARLLAAQGIDCFAISTQAIRLVTHLDVTAGEIDQACQIIRSVACSSRTSGV